MITFQSREASETERSSYRIAVAQMLKRCASLPFTEALGNAVACQEPAAGPLISVNQKYGGPPWRSREVAATLPSGPVSESSP